MARRQPGRWVTILTSTVIATLISSGLSYYQIDLARKDNRASIVRQNLIDLQDNLVRLVASAKHVYLSDVENNNGTGTWKNYTDKTAVREVVDLTTQLNARVVRVNDPILTKHINAVQAAVSALVDARSRRDVELAAGRMVQHSELANKRFANCLSLSCEVSISVLRLARSIDCGAACRLRRRVGEAGSPVPVVSLPALRAAGGRPQGRP
jgi:hypothetical protein